MAPQTLQAPTTTEHKEAGQIEAIWHSTEKLTNGLLKEAKDDQIEAGGAPTPKSCLESAYSMHVADLEAAKEIDPATGEAEIDNWPISIATANNLSLVILHTPFAAAAVHQLNNKNSEAKEAAAKATISQFNQNLATCMAYMHPDMLKTLASTLPEQSEELLSKWGLPVLPQEHYRRIFAGVSREVAVLRKLKKDETYKSRSATTEEDGAGTDVVVTNKEGLELRLDVKTQAGFERTLQKYIQWGELTPEEADEARKKGYVYMSGKQGVENCVFDADKFGVIENFDYKQGEDGLLEFIDEQFEAGRGKKLRKLGKSAIIN